MHRCLHYGTYQNDYQSGFLELHLRLVHTFVTQEITGLVFCCTSLRLLALATELSGLGRGAKTEEGTEKIIVLQCNKDSISNS